MADFVTRCPKCNTSFKLTLEHFKTAKGAVRCGSCLNVFKAHEHWATPLNSAQQKQIEDILNPAPVGANFSLELDDDDILISDDMDGEEKTPKDTGSLFEIEGFSSEFKSLAEPSGQNRKSGFSASAYDDEESSSFDESWTEGLLGDDSEDNYSRPNKEAKVEPLPDPDPEDDWSSNLGVEGGQGYSEEELFSEDEKDSRQDLLAGIQPEPVQFQTHNHRANYPQLLLWSGLSVLAVFTLLIQLALWQKNDLARQEQWRPMYQQACNILGCKLPKQIDVNRIRSHSLIVRSHPKYENALLVDTILMNIADFQQPFPKLQLVFSDLQGTVVANRLFSPDEYLGGELSGANLMPARQPIHLALEIADPGERAVNYQLHISP